MSIEIHDDDLIVRDKPYIPFTDIFNDLRSVDLRGRMYTKTSGGTDLDYVPWATAVDEVCKRYDAEYTIHKFGENQLPYLDTGVGLMVETDVTIGGNTRMMFLPILDSANRAMKLEAWSGTTSRGKEFTVAAATATDINKAIMRCLTKNFAMFGLGLHLWSKEEAPEIVLETEKYKNECLELITKKCALSEATKKAVGELCKSILPEECNGDPRLCDDTEKLIELKKKLMAVRKK